MYRLSEETYNRTYRSSAFLIALTISLFVKGLPTREQITQNWDVIGGIRRTDPHLFSGRHLLPAADDVAGVDAPAGFID